MAGEERVSVEKATENRAEIGKRLFPVAGGVRLHLFHLHAEHIKGLNCMRYTCKVTGKGQIYFVNKFKEIVNGKTKA